ncbi:MAG: SDR family NAD(P)-dependent oxidoreductase, partial [Gemmatimonadetes bacterium]|nr:SDR family NAD(P)-dependent oxidoreductase [Gemmatimonadota bacterium]
MTALAGRVALVTGASRGIGAAVADAFGAAGATVIRVARTLEDRSRDGRLDIRADLTDAAQVSGMSERVRAEAGVPDIVVHNAGGF